MTKIQTTLKINKLKLKVNIGWSKYERQKKRTVVLDALITFAKPPKACQSDDLADSVCYRELCHSIHKEVTNKPFALVENLAQSIYQLLKKQLPPKSKLSITITKFPRIKALQEGVAFCYEDK